jgi:hypothetical protein
MKSRVFTLVAQFHQIIPFGFFECPCELDSGRHIVKHFQDQGLFGIF